MWTVMLICVNRVLAWSVYFVRLGPWNRVTTVCRPNYNHFLSCSVVVCFYIHVQLFHPTQNSPKSPITHNPPPPVYKYRWRFDNSLSNFKTAIFVSFHLMCGYRYNTIHSLYVSFSHSYLQQDCPNGRLTPAKFVDMYKMFFPSGNAEEFCDHVFRTFDMDKNGYIDFKVG